MPDYLITFTGHVDIHKRPDGFPHEIKDLVFISTDSPEGLVKAVNDHHNIYIRNQGMGVDLDPHGMQDAVKLSVNRAWVPMHMLTYISPEIKLIGQKNGVSVLADAHGLLSDEDVPKELVQ